MFDLEQAIADWRRNLEQHGLRNSDVTNELEAHLRDSIDAQRATGTPPQDAFEKSLASMGTTTELKSEFQCAGVPLNKPIHMKKALCVLAGIPTAPLDAHAPAAITEPAWATYTKAAFFASPALLLWIFSVVFLIPKLQFLSNRAGIELPSAIHFANMLSDQATPIALTTLAALALLELKTQTWPHYRRATLGLGVFALNTTILILTGTLIVYALLAAV